MNNKFLNRMILTAILFSCVGNKKQGANIRKHGPQRFVPILYVTAIALVTVFFMIATQTSAIAVEAHISAGYYHTVGLKTDGTVVAVGYNLDGQCNVGGWTDIVQVSAGWDHSVGLKSDGTVVAVGNNSYGQCNVSGWDLEPESATLSITIPATATEGDGTLPDQGIVDISEAPGSDLTVSLTSSDTTEVIVSATVVIPQGSTSTNFDLTILDDSDIDGTQTATITASAPGIESANDSIDIQDNDGMDIFGIDLDNLWQYQGMSQAGAYTREEEVLSIDESSFAFPTYIVESRPDNGPAAKVWFEKTNAELKLWKIDDTRFDYAGLTIVWYPMQVNDSKYSKTTSVTWAPDPLVPFDVSMTVDVLAKESVNLSFDTLEAYKLRYIFRVWGYGTDDSETYYYWWVPYLGFIKYQDNETTEELTSFSIGGGTITQETDTDGDGLKDYQEKSIYNTDRLDSDSDDDGLNDGEEVNTYETDPNNEDTDNDGLTDGDEVNAQNTDPANEDSDNDGLNDGDEVNIHNTDPNDEDTDGDELNDGDEIALGTNPNNPDTDGDGMPDGWEDTHDLDPLSDDAADDPDGDGLTNLQEYNQGRHPTNVEPDTPVLLLPDDAATDIPLTVEMQTQDFSDADGHNHAQSRWQISTVENDFSESFLVLDIISDSHLTSFTVPEFMLSINTIYYWRVKFYDDGNAASDWSGPFSFKTIIADENDQNQNGVPDNQEIDDPTLDLDNNGTPDINQGDMKCVNTEGGAAQIGIKEGTNVTSIECLMWTDPDTIDDTHNKPDDIPLGLVNFKVLVNNAGDTAEMTVYLSEPAPAGAKWYKYDPINGWQDYSAHAIFNADRTSVTLQFMDGGFGDADGVANAIIIDPSGPGVGIAGAGGGGGGGSAGCFISTIAYGFCMPKELFVLILLLGFLMIGHSKFRKKFRR